MRSSLSNRVSLWRESAATAQTCQVRVEGNLLTERGIHVLSFGCEDTRQQVSRGFAQSSLYHVAKQNVVNGQ